MCYYSKSSLKPFCWQEWGWLITKGLFILLVHSPRACSAASPRAGIPGPEEQGLCQPTQHLQPQPLCCAGARKANLLFALPVMLHQMEQRGNFMLERHQINIERGSNSGHRINFYFPESWTVATWIQQDKLTEFQKFNVTSNQNFGYEINP